MPSKNGTTNEYGFKSPAPVKVRGKNPSVKREFKQAQNTTGASSKNPSGSLEAPYSNVGLNRNRQGSQYEPYGVAGSRNRSSRNDSIDREFTVDVPRSKNKGSVNKEEPVARINSGKTKVHNYPSGRNRGRNFKG